MVLHESIDLKLEGGAKGKRE